MNDFTIRKVSTQPNYSKNAVSKKPKWHILWALSVLAIVSCAQEIVTAGIVIYEPYPRDEDYYEIVTRVFQQRLGIKMERDVFLELEDDGVRIDFSADFYHADKKIAVERETDYLEPYISEVLNQKERQQIKNGKFKDHYIITIPDMNNDNVETLLHQSIDAYLAENPEENDHE